MSKPRKLLDLCGGCGAWSKPFRDAGWDVQVVTLPEHDVCTYSPPDDVDGVLAAPPCEHFSFARVGKVELHTPRDTESALRVVRACLRIIAECEARKPLAFHSLENPVGHLQRFIGTPRYTFQPWEFGDPWTKRTALWGKFRLPCPLYRSWEDVPKNPALYIRPPRKKPNMIWLHKSAQRDIQNLAAFPPAASDAAFRAITPQGFAHAFFEANAHVI